MAELNTADRSLLSWVYQTGIPAHALSIRFNQDTLVVNCQTVEEAMTLWETRSRLKMSGKELCFQVNQTFYVGATVE